VDQPAFSDEERAALARLLAVILPSTSGPGATEADAIDYVVGRLHKEDPEIVVGVRAHLPAAAEDPVAVIAALASDPTGPGYQVFRRIRAWAWEGFLCDPKHGGNRDHVGWQRFGIPRSPQPLGWTVEDLEVVDEGAHP